MIKSFVLLCLVLTATSLVYAGGGYSAIQQAGNRMKKQLRGISSGEKNSKPAAKPKPQPAKPQAKTSNIPIVSTGEMEDFVEDGQILIIDARFGKFDDRTRIPGAKSFKGKYSKKRVQRKIPDKDQTIIVYGPDKTSEIGSSFAEYLSKLGYTNVKLYADGMKGWIDAGNKVKKLKKRNRKRKKKSSN